MSRAAIAPQPAGQAAPTSVAPLDRAWYDRPAAEVAIELLGARLIRSSPDGRVVGRIVEVEAYEGPEDLAAHSARGRTARNSVMFGQPGHLYVYLVYGIHHCANVVCGPGDKPEAVLLRAAEITEGAELVRSRRGDVAPARRASGPGNLAVAFGIDRTLNGSDLLAGPITLAPGPRPAQVMRSTRIGVGYAGTWADAPLRFLIADDPHRSRP